MATNQNAMTLDQRWAYDLVIEPARHRSKKLEDYGCYGMEVVAPVSARVHSSTDGVPDHPLSKISMDIANLSSNVIVFSLETGTYLAVARLKRRQRLGRG